MGFFLTSSFAWAQNPDLKSYARAIPELLVSRGLKQVGELDLEKLLNEINGVQFEWTKSKISAGPDQSRYGCNYSITPPRVHCSAHETSVAVLPLLALHEALGALGYQDQDYELSSRLNIYALMNLRQEIPLLSRVFINLKKQTRDEVFIVAGGGTSVGGGGDSVGATIKSFGGAIILSLLSDKALQPNQIKQIELAFERIMELKVENNPDKAASEVALRQTSSGYQALIPYRLWNYVQQNHSQPDKIINQQIQIYGPIFEYAMRAP